MPLQIEMTFKQYKKITMINFLSNRYQLIQNYLFHLSLYTQIVPC